MAPVTTYFFVILGALVAASNVGAVPIGPANKDLNEGPGRGIGEGPGKAVGEGPGRGVGEGPGRGVGKGPDKGNSLSNGACTAARTQIVSRIRSTNREVVSIAESDTALAGAVDTILKGLQETETGVTEISDSFLQGALPSQTSRQRIVNGLTVARDTLDGISSDSPQVKRAKLNLGQTIQVGNRILTECGKAGEAPPAEETPGEETLTESVSATETAALEPSTEAVVSPTAEVTTTAGAEATDTCPPAVTVTERPDAAATAIVTRTVVLTKVAQVTVTQAQAAPDAVRTVTVTESVHVTASHDSTSAVATETAETTPAAAVQPTVETTSVAAVRPTERAVPNRISFN